MAKSRERPDADSADQLPGLRPNGVSRLAAEVKAGNQIALQAPQACQVRIHISRDLFDLRQPVKVALNGKPARAYPLQCSRENLLKTARRLADRERLYWGSVVVPVQP